VFELDGAQQFFLILACQHALRTPELNVTAGLVLHDIARGLEMHGLFGDEQRKIIAAGWRTP
jgi:hypothetical protein